MAEARSGRWGQGLTAAKMAECKWVKLLLVAQFEFVGWTPDDHLRLSPVYRAARGQRPKKRQARILRSRKAGDP